MPPLQARLTPPPSSVRGSHSGSTAAPDLLSLLTRTPPHGFKEEWLSESTCEGYPWPWALRAPPAFSARSHRYSGSRCLLTLCPVQLLSFKVKIRAGPWAASSLMICFFPLLHRR